MYWNPKEAMIINWIEVRASEEDESATEYIVGATTEERVRSAGFLDPDETSPAWVILKTYPPEDGKASVLTGSVFPAHPSHPEHQCGIDALKGLMAAVFEIEGLTREEAHKKLWGRVIEPQVFHALGLPTQRTSACLKSSTR